MTCQPTALADRRAERLGWLNQANLSSSPAKAGDPVTADVTDKTATLTVLWRKRHGYLGSLDLIRAG
jgi:NADP-dependent 3-hydroxy acid dehydrogenase YdfG